MLQPTEFPEDDVSGKSVEPSAPPLTDLPNLPGYEGVGEEGGFSDPPPPSYDEAMGTDPEIMVEMPRVTEERVRAALRKFASSHTCYRSSPADSCQIRSINPRWDYRYSLESYTERRSCAWTAIPYSVALQYPAGAGEPPTPWNVNVNKTVPEWQDGGVNVEVPYTARVQPCQNCASSGIIICSSCSGRGMRRCMCGAGRMRMRRDGEYHHCAFCRGSGWKRCHKCNGTGRMQCQVCQGYKQIKVFIQMNVQWKNEVFDRMISHQSDSALPTEVEQQARGQLVVEDTGLPVVPFRQFVDENVVQASHAAIQEHKDKLKLFRLLKQRQRVWSVPVTEIVAEYHSDERRFFLIGLDDNVHFPDYWAKCCCAVM